jgi:hypothetical protein
MNLFRSCTRTLEYILPIIAIIGAFSFVTIPANAQIIQPVSVKNLITTIEPLFPSPGQQVTITVNSYSIDINSATIVWEVNGKQYQKGVGQTKLTIAAPTQGKTMSVKITATTPTGLQTTDSITIKPSSVDMIIEPFSYTPPFFLGKLGVSYQNRLRIIAMPHISDSSGKEISPTNLVYQWKKDSGTVYSDQSGFGKQYIDLDGTLVPRPYSVTVTVTTKDGTTSAQGIASIIPHAPRVVFYVNDPLYGQLFNKAIGDSFRLGTESESGIVAIPLGFSGAPGDSNLSFGWMINGFEHPELNSKDSIVLRAPSDAAGSSNIQLTVNNTAGLIQAATGNFSVIFSATASSSQRSIQNVTF